MGQSFATARRLACFATVVWAAGALAQAYGPSAAPYRPVSRAITTQRKGTLGITDSDRSRLAAAADRLAPQRPGVVDAYVIVAALDSDPVFGREAREAGKVLAERYDARDRTIVLAGLDGRSITPLARGGPETLGEAINRISHLIDPNEDALILYITAHGSPAGLAYRDGQQLLATVPPIWLAEVLRRADIRNRLVIVSACYSGIFVPTLASPSGAVITAAAADRTSFGCASDNDWTFFGDALVNHALRKPQSLAAAFVEARGLIGKWEADGRLISSNPQAAIGSNTSSWLRPLEARMPKSASAPVGRPATDAIQRAVAANH